MAIKKLLLIELNEFNQELLKSAAETYGLHNVQRLLSFAHCRAAIDDNLESDFLEPWVQWVSIHTGRPSTEHQVKHLGDVPSLKYPQIWETLGKEGVSCGVWGVLNGAAGASPQTKFFVPDPWTFSEEARPAELNSLLGLPRYLARNRLHFSPLQAARHAWKLMELLAKHGLLMDLVRAAPQCLFMLCRYRGAFAGFALTEYLSALLFMRFRKAHNPDFSILFLNSIAHIQHYYWSTAEIAKNKRFKYCFHLVDKILGKVIDSVAADVDSELIVTNGLTQVNSTADKPFVSYRPMDHDSFLRFAGLRFVRVEPLMSYDAHIIFATKEDLEHALSALKSARAGEQPLFLVEHNPTVALKLFYRLAFTDAFVVEPECMIDSKSFRFNKYFQKIVVRTGKHAPFTDIYSMRSNVSHCPFNHNLYEVIGSLLLARAV